MKCFITAALFSLASLVSARVVAPSCAQADCFGDVTIITPITGLHIGDVRIPYRWSLHILLTYNK